MPFDFTKVPKKSEININARPNNHENQYDRVVSRLQTKLNNMRNGECTLRIARLTEEDKNSLTEGLNGLGYTCVIEGNKMHVQ